MKTHTIQEGEGLEDLAGEHGYADWTDIYLHPSNDALREQKPTLGLLEPGDILKILPAPAAAGLGVGTGAPITVVVTPQHRGKLYWNRTWSYSDSTKAQAPTKEFLPGAKVELHIQKKGATALSLHATGFLTESGEFKFKGVPECTKMELKIFLEHQGRATVLKGASNAVADADFEVKTGAVIWHKFPLDLSKAKKVGSDIQFGELEITKPLFVDLCDAYKTMWTGHLRIKQLAGYTLNLCPVNYPSTTTSFHRAGQLYLLKDDLKDRSVILHEYGHYIGHEVLGGLTHPGYGYNDDVANQHSPRSKEHYESAWNESHATFLACVMRGTPVYHDGYDTSLTLNLAKDNTTVGPHCESSIQEALWRVHAVHKVDFKKGFWKAFTDRSKRTVRTVFDLYDNWKELKCPGLDTLKEAYGKFNLTYGYRYTKRFTLVRAPLKLDLKAGKFTRIDELYDAFGKLGGGTLADYKEEFYNRNKQFNAASLGAGSTLAAWTMLDGMSYIVPERFKIG